MSSKNFYGLTGDVTVDGGILNVGNAQLYANTETSNVGIGTTNAEFKLDVHGDANVENLYATYLHGDGSNIENIVSSQWEGSPGDPIYYTSNVGIANTAPVTKTLQVGSNLYVEDAGSNVIHVTGNIYADYLVGDGSQLTGIAASLDQIVDQGNTVSNTIQIVSGQDATSNIGLVTHEGVSISVSNANPTGAFQFGVGSNLLVNVYSSNVLTVDGNVLAQKMTLGTVTVTPAYNLQQITTKGATTSQTLILENATTGLTTSSNVGIANTAPVHTLDVGSNLYVEDTGSNVLTVTGNAYVSNLQVAERLDVGSNLHIENFRVAEVASNLVTYDSTTGELMDSGGLFSNKLAVVSEQPPIALTGASTVVTNHGTYTIEASSGTVTELFDKNDLTKWETDENYSTNGDNKGHYIRSASLAGYDGEWVKITMPYKTILRHMVIESTNQSVEDIRIVGLNSDGLTWSDLKTVTGLTGTTHTIIVNATTHHKTYGLIVEKTNTTTGRSAVEIGDLKLFTESFSIDGGKVEMATSAVMGGETTMDQHGPHSRDPKAVPLKKYPERVKHSISTNQSPIGANTFAYRGFTLSSSTTYAFVNHNLSNAIDDNKATAWSSHGDYDTSGNPTSTDFPNGHYIQLELPNKIRLKNTMIQSQKTSGYYNSPKNVKIYGSNDGLSWTLIKTATNLPLNGPSLKTTIDVDSTNYYKYHRLEINNIYRIGGYYGRIAEWELYGYEEDPPAGDTSVDTTFTSIMNTPQTTGANVYVDAKLSSDFTNRVTGPTPVGTAEVHDNINKYWELNGTLTSNITVEANTFLEGDAPHSVSVWFNSSNLVSNASNSCIFSLGTEERFDHVGAAFSNNYQTVQKITAGSRSTTNANFGNSCAINSDGTRMIVGAYFEDNGGTNYGAVYIYTYSNGKWDNGVRIGAPTPVSGTADQAFGVSVAMNSAGTRVVVGAHYDDTGANDAGAAYVYSYSNGSWTLDTVSGDATGRIQALDKAASDRFGFSVAMSGDGTRIIVGRTANVTSHQATGAAYIYTYSSGSWGSEKKLTASDAQTNDNFGASVAMTSDGTKVVVGAPFEDTGGSNYGKVYTYIYNSGSDSWVENSQKLQATSFLGSGSGGGDIAFGSSVSMNSDGTKMIVGAHFEDTGTGGVSTNDSGSAYIYTYSGGSWGSEVHLQASDVTAAIADGHDDEFGWCVRMSSDGTTVIVGVRFEDQGSTDSGAAYIFAYDGSNWGDVAKLKAYDGATNDHFGFSVAISGDGKRVVVGADGDDDSPGSSSGSVYVYDRDTTHHLTTDLKLQSNTWHNLTYAYQGEGGSRVTYLDGRKVAEDQAEDTFGDYPPFAMTGYSQGGYVVSASSEYIETGALRYAYGAYDPSVDFTGAAGHVWMTEFDTFNPNAVGGDTFTDSNGGTHTGHWNKLELPYKLKPSYLYYKNTGTYTTARCASDWVILGSNDDIIWDLVHNSTTVLDTTLNIPINSTKAYKYLMFLCKTINSSTALYVQQLAYYGHRENDLVRLPDPTNVLKYPHISIPSSYAKRGYVVSASNDQYLYGIGNIESRGAWAAFDNTDSYWQLSYDSAPYDSTPDGNGFYQNNGNASTLTGTSHRGEWIKLELPHKLMVQKMKTDHGSQPERLGQVILLGSNNDSDWYTIKDTFALTTASAQTTDINATIAYKYIVLIVKSLQNASINVDLKNLEYYGTGVDSIPIQIGGGNIDKVANFRIYDKFIGEDQALEIWDAQKDEFGRAKSSMTLHKGRLGIGTTEPEGRLAVADEPHNLEEFPPRAMTGYKTYFEGHGEFCASASSYYGTYYPWEAFDRNITDNSSDQDVWHTTADFTNATPGIYNAGASLGGYTGAWLKLKLPYSIKPSKVSIHPRTYPGGTSNYGQNPLDFLILGSKDDNTWDVLSTQVGVVFGTTWKEFILSPANNNYKYFAISCTKTKQGSYFAICDMKYFGTREQGQSVLHDGQLTLTKNLNVPRIGPPLDADDTPRRDRLVVEYNTSTNPTFEGAVRDTSGRGNDGVFVGTATYDATQKSLEFPSNPVTGTTSGTYDSIFAGDIFKQKITQHTTSLWLKPNSMGAWEQIFGIGQAADVVHEGLWISGTDTLAVHTEGANPSQQYHYNIGNSNGRWIHVTLVRNSLTFGDHILYVNGTSLTPTTTSGGTGTMSIPEESDLRIGGRIRGNDNYWLDGAISNFKLYDTVLTAQEVKTLYDMGRTGHIVNPQPLHIAAPVQVEKTLRIPVDNTYTGAYTAGMIRYNQDLGKIQVHNGSGWLTIGGGVSATGGTVTYADGYTIHTFTDSGTFTVYSGGDIEYLVVAGGGGGGKNAGAGGGAGGMLSGTLTGIGNDTYAITVGEGGAGGTTDQIGTLASKGSDSSIAELVTAEGGGAGVNSGGTSGGDGGSGGGAGNDTTGNQNGGNGASGQGNNGGAGTVPGGATRTGGGGGGAGAVGEDSVSSTKAGNGGIGRQSDITGTMTYYAGGGGGGVHNGTGGTGGLGGGGGENEAGTDGLGGGGGAARSGDGNGKKGGSGIVIIRYI